MRRPSSSPQESGPSNPRPIPIGEEWVGRGVVYFVPQLAEHTNKDVVIIGGGDSAFDWAWALTPIANSVTLVHRRDQFRARINGRQGARCRRATGDLC